ncbi:MAG TPA: 50S ribosomal protein L1 [Spirochaetota bacterium]|nr:50S ribosomal protein L1 [Spirochaetota bacterium]HPI90266.1 50S ribosomal protein L1 [Spirochaetota bacterium]HPR46493.1 50S ribosomal protein L1 [Spirochaetota bacterium]
MKRGKKIVEARSKVDKSNLYSVDEAVKIMKDNKFVKFNESVDMSVKVVHKSYQNIRGTATLPAGTGKEKKVLVICKGDKQKEALEAGADYVGAEDIIEKIKGGWVDYQAVVATPDMMKEVGKLGQVLGRKGLMPKPKSGTVTDDIKGIVKELKGGRVEYRADKTGVIHMIVGKITFDDASIASNIKSFYNQIIKDKPSDAKGNYIKSVHISSSMGPGIKINHKGIEK